METLVLWVEYCIPYESHTNQFEMKFLINIIVSCCRTAVGVGQRALSLSAHTVGGPPPSWPRGG